jgi:hypothetical protein
MTGESLPDHGALTRGPGDPAPGFYFVGSDGHLHSFYEVCGDVALVLFATDPDWPDCELCREMAAHAERLSSDQLRVMVVTLSQGEGSPATELANLRACGVPSDHLVAITDHHRTIRDTWGPDAGGRFFVVNPVGRIEWTGVGPEAAALRLEEAVARAEFLFGPSADD